MNRIVFENAKNGSLTCTADGKFLHSKYNPQKEAENFADNLKIQQNPSYIVITEPCISYVAAKIKEKYKDAKIAAIRYSHEFYSYNHEFDLIFYASDENQAKNISSALINKIGEKNLLNSAFLQWLPAANAFPELNKKVWEGIKSAVEYARATLFTNSFFSKRWFLNSIRNLIRTENFYQLNRTNLPVVIAASGRSLEKCIPHLKKARENFFLIGLSSATEALLKNKIIPDFVLSTDGGYWAQKHLEALKKHPEIPVAIAVEAACPSFLLKKNPIILLKYCDGFSRKILDALNLNFDSAERNGTVSGTAVLLAAKLTEKNIYVCGLDLHSSKGFQHTMPNALEIFSIKKDSKISGAELRAAKAEFSSGSLKIYENWFSDEKRNFNGKVFRLSENFCFKNSLNTVKDVNFDFFYKNEGKKQKSLENIKKINVEKKFFAEKIHNFIAEKSKTEEWMDEFFCAETFALKNKNTDNEKGKILDEIFCKNKRFLQKIENLIR